MNTITNNDHQAEQPVEKQGRIKALRGFLLSKKSGSRLPKLFLIALVMFPVLDTLMTFLTGMQWQLSGYYLFFLKGSVYLLLAGLWAASIVLLVLDRQYQRGFLRVAAIPLIFILGSFVSLFCLIFPSTISDRPIDTVFSKTRNQYFILAYTPVPTDVCYTLFSTKGTLFNPVWKVECGGTELDYSEDGSLTDNPLLILSENEELLVISRGGHLTDAILIDTGRALTAYVSCFDEDREIQWEERTRRIKELLLRHAETFSSPQNSLSYPQIRNLLTKYCEKLADELTSRFLADQWVVSCELTEVDWNNGKVHAYVNFTLSRKHETHTFFRDMQLAEDHGELIIIKQDNGLSWSGENEKKLCEKLRDILNEIAGTGTYVK